MNLQEISKYSDVATVEETSSSTTAKESASNQEDDGFDDDDDLSVDDAIGAENAVVGAMVNKEEEEVNEKKPRLHPAWTVQIVLVCLIGIWVGFMVIRNKRRHKDYFQGGWDGIMPGIHEDRNRPLSEIM